MAKPHLCIRHTHKAHNTQQTAAYCVAHLEGTYDVKFKEVGVVKLLFVVLLVANHLLAYIYTYIV